MAAIKKTKTARNIDILIARISQPIVADRREEKLLIARAQKGDEAAMRRLVCSYCGFVMSVTKRYRNRGLEMEDLFLLGLAGVYTAITRFKASKKARLITYASWWVRASIQRGLAENSHTISIPINVYQKLHEYAAVSQMLHGKDGAEPTDADTAAKIGVTTTELKRLRATSAIRMVPIDEPVHVSGHNTVGDLYMPPDAEPTDALTMLERRRDVDAVQNALRSAKLSEVERAVIYQTFFKDRSLVETAAIIVPLMRRQEPVTPERIRQLKKRALEKLAKALA